MAQPREDASTARPLTLRVLGNIDHFPRLYARVDAGRASAAAWPSGEASQSRGCRAARRSRTSPASTAMRTPTSVGSSTTSSASSAIRSGSIRVYYFGEIVQKSLRNGAHDGQVLRSPVSTRLATPVYQHLIDNRTCGNRIIDLRVPYIAGIAPICWIKCRPMEKRFASQSAWARLATPDELFSVEEQALITRFCEEVRLEYGELDVLRDVQCDSIYVVDVNPTPYPLTNGIEHREWSRAVRQMAVRFQEVFLS